jgi:hypothetical protein
MTPYTPTSRRQRAALAALSFGFSLLLLGSVLLLFSDGQMPWREVQAKASVQAPLCTTGAPLAAPCPTRVARAEAPVEAQARR